MISGLDLNYSRKHLTRFPNIKTESSINKFDLSNNDIVTFYGLKPTTAINTLILDNNPKLSSFIGLTESHNPMFSAETSGDQSNEGIVNLSLLKTPLGEYPQIKLMAVIVFGNALAMINGSQIPYSTYSLANKLRDETLPYLLDGWIIISTKPLRILNTKTRARKILYPKPQESQSQISINEAVKEEDSKSVDVFSEIGDGQEEKENQQDSQQQKLNDEQYQDKFETIKQDYINEMEKKSNSPHHSPNNTRTLTKTSPPASPKNASTRAILRDSPKRAYQLEIRKSPNQHRIRPKNIGDTLFFKQNQQQQQQEEKEKNDPNENIQFHDSDNIEENIDENSVHQSEDGNEIDINNINEPASESEGTNEI